MKDKNGTEIKTGMIVEITEAYFKNDNGLYVVTASPGDRFWNGEEHCLTRISKAGKISTAKYRICFWPIAVFGGSQSRRVEARVWNAHHAEIEVKQIENMDGVIAYFQEARDRAKDALDRTVLNFGEDSPFTDNDRAILAEYEEVIFEIRERMA